MSFLFRHGDPHFGRPILAGRLPDAKDGTMGSLAMTPGGHEATMTTADRDDHLEDTGWPGAESWASALGAAYRFAIDYLSTVPNKPVSRHASPEVMAPRFADPLPAHGCPPDDALADWFARAEPGIVRSSGPRYFGFVTGGAFPAALAGDWLASAIDQNAFGWLASPAAAQTEVTAIRWLLELFSLPSAWSGALTTGATMANLAGLAAARQWASHRLGFDAARDGLGGRPAIPVIASEEIHQSALKALGVLGLGRTALTVVPSQDGAIDLSAFERALTPVDGPAIVVANAGDVNTGAFDPIRRMVEICAAHHGGAWLHVDGAFGLYAALSPRHRQLLDGIELADSVASDAHKWLNVPYDCGFVFVSDSTWSRGAFGASGAYLQIDPQQAVWNAIEYVPEMSRRFRALSVWCALKAAGRSGFTDVVTRSIANAERFAAWVAAQPDLELMSPARLNIVCFRVRADVNDDANDARTEALVGAIQRGGVAYVTGTRWRDRAAIRAAFDNWATGPEDVEALQSAVSGALAEPA
jgi:glutamate/tyrosine decarboxylase-like PLP-dependent enzyme